MDGSDRDIALSMLFSDHYLDKKNLEALGRDNAAGVDVKVDDAVIDTMTQKLTTYLDMFRKRNLPTQRWWQLWKR